MTDASIDRIITALDFLTLDEGIANVRALLDEAANDPQAVTALDVAWPIERIAPDGISWLDHYNAEVERRGAAEAEVEALRDQLRDTVTTEYHDNLILQAQAEINTRGNRIAELEAAIDAAADHPCPDYGQFTAECRYAKAGREQAAAHAALLDGYIDQLRLANEAVDELTAAHAAEVEALRETAKHQVDSLRSELEKANAEVKRLKYDTLLGPSEAERDALKSDVAHWKMNAGMWHDSFYRFKAESDAAVNEALENAAQSITDKFTPDATFSLEFGNGMDYAARIVRSAIQKEAK